MQKKIKIPIINSEFIATLYQTIGFCVLMMQALEKAIMEYLIFKHKIDIKTVMNEVRSIFDSASKRTLGSLIKELSGFEDDFISLINNDLNNLLNERNWLIHKSFESTHPDMYKDGKRNKLYNRINKAGDDAISLARKISDETQRVIVKKGFWTEDELLRRTQEVADSWCK